MTNSAVWIVINQGAEFDLADITLHDNCEAFPEPWMHCWNIMRRGSRVYQLTRNSIPNANNLLDWAGVYMDIPYKTDPMSVSAERMVICDGDVQEFPSDVVTETIVSTTPMTATSTRPVSIGNSAYNRLDSAKNNWDEMISRSIMTTQAKKRTVDKFNRICNKLKNRHDKMTNAGCQFELADEIIFGAVLIDFEDTCETTGKLIQGN